MVSHITSSCYYMNSKLSFKQKACDSHDVRRNKLNGQAEKETAAGQYSQR